MSYGLKSFAHNIAVLEYHVLLFFNLESIAAVRRFNTVLRPIVFHDHLVRHVATRCHNVDASQKMPTPKGKT